MNIKMSVVFFFFFAETINLPMVERRISAVDRFRFDCDIVVDGIRRRENIAN